MNRLMEVLPDVDRPFVLLLLLAVALITRIAYVSSLDASVRYPDAQEYVSYAKHLVQQGEFQNDKGERATRTPGYPIFLAGLFGLFGENVTVVRLVQSLLDTASMLLLFSLITILSYQTAAYFAAGMYAVYPTIIYMTGTILTESLFIFVLLACMLCTCRYLFRGQQWRDLVGSGLFAGVLAQIHPSTMMFLPFLIAVIACCSFDRTTKLKTGVSFLLFLLPLLPWTLRNYQVYGALMPGTTRPGFALYEAFGPEATGGPRGNTDFLPAEQQGMNEHERNVYLRNRGLHWMLSRPLRSLRLAVFKFVRTWTPLPNASQFQSFPYVVVLPLTYLTVLIGAVCGIIYTERTDHVFLLLAPVIYVALLHVIFIGSIRYRIPVMPYLIGLAGIGFSRLLSKQLLDASS